MPCRICGDPTDTVLDLGSMPAANRLKTSKQEEEPRYPLVLERCAGCFNLQLRDCVDENELYGHYLYLTPDSRALHAHNRLLVEHMFREGYASAGSFVLEIGSNVGRFLKHLQPHVRKVVGIDPAENVCRIARADGIETVCAFFAVDLAMQLEAAYGVPDVIVARHCCAHNKNPHRIIAGIKALLPENGIFIMENAYAPNTLLNNEFDQIYHEHMFYYAIRPVVKLLEMHDMRLVDIAMAPIHGGSVVFFAAHATARSRVRESVRVHMNEEQAVLGDELLGRFVESVRAIRRDIRALVADLLGQGKTVWSYGATAKGSTLLNYIGLTDEHIRFCADSTPIKHGRFIPMANIEILPEEEAWKASPDYFLLTAWNYKDEIIPKVRAMGNARTKFIVPIPSVSVQ